VTSEVVHAFTPISFNIAVRLWNIELSRLHKCRQTVLGGNQVPNQRSLRANCEAVHKHEAGEAEGTNDNRLDYVDTKYHVGHTENDGISIAAPT
jgi:hypothetical protein